MPRNDALENEIHTLLADDQYRDHPLRETLVALFRQYKNGQLKLQRLLEISDGFQWMAREQKETLKVETKKQQRQLHRITSISDRYQKMLQQKNEELYLASTHDHLTGIPNRRLMLQRLDEATDESLKTGTAFSIAIIDVDGFKAINDEFGHDMGDRVLVQVANALKERIRSEDVCARWGGEEFLILLPAVPGTRARQIAERLRREVEQLLFKESAPPIRCSISIGVAEHRLTAKSAETISRADQALYTAKRKGKNKAELAE